MSAGFVSIAVRALPPPGTIEKARARASVVRAMFLSAVVEGTLWARIHVTTLAARPGLCKDMRELTEGDALDSLFIEGTTVYFRHMRSNNVYSVHVPDSVLADPLYKFTLFETPAGLF